MKETLFVLVGFIFIVAFGVCDVLGLIFLVLKLVGTVDWSWLWVLSPWWGSMLTLIVINLLTPPR